MNKAKTIREAVTMGGDNWHLKLPWNSTLRIAHIKNSCINSRYETQIDDRIRMSLCERFGRSWQE